MEIFTIKDLNFTYPEKREKTLDGLNLSIKQGEFLTIVGPSGCGKSTLLRHMKTVLAPHGTLRGEILYDGRLLSSIDLREQSAQIGFVMQNPDNQIVTDKVWHELAFGLESLGYDTQTIRRRVAEMSSFFGIQTWFHKNVVELSGGQKQLLSLASIMAMQPSVLVLDEPTSQLDPIAAADFLATLGRINRELGTTIIMTEHRLEEVFPMTDKVVVMEKGKLICEGSPSETGEFLKSSGHPMFFAMPTPMRIYGAVNAEKNQLSCPITIRDGRLWLDEFSKNHKLNPVRRKKSFEDTYDHNFAIELDDVWFKYERDLPDVLRGLSLKVQKGEFLAILGGNGTGKTTSLSVISGINKPYRGRVFLDGKDGSKQNNLLGEHIAMLPQNPQAIFVKKTVYDDLMEILKGKTISKIECDKKIKRISHLCRLDDLLLRHPYDLSGGEQQRAALAKVLLLEPRILLLDEPTKGLDAEYKQCFARVLQNLLKEGITIVMVSHDIEFCAQHASKCAMFFDGGIVVEDVPQAFFSGNSFYTTCANRMSRHLLPEAVTAEDVILACGGVLPPAPEQPVDQEENDNHGEDTKPLERKEKISFNKRKLPKRTVIATAMIACIIPLTLYIGIFYLQDRKYYFISLLIILETMLPFFLIFEGRKPQARELVIISVLCAIGVAGRSAFFMLPQFKPVAAMVIISGVAFGGEAGFFVGAVTMFVSNMMFGQGPWTPMQMFAMGVIGFLSGVLFRKGFLRRSRFSLAAFGGLATILIYGGLMNPSFAMISQHNSTWQMLISSYIMGFPMDLIHASATVFFLWFFSQPMLEKLDRIKTKYGLVEPS